MADDSDRKKKMSIPSWQKTSSDNESSTPTNASNATENQSSVKELDVLEQARRFLQDESVQNSSTEKKRAFLEKKGVATKDMDTLLGEEQEQSSSSTEESELQTIHDSTVDSPPAADTQQPSSIIPQRSEATPSPTITTRRTDIPPIITYPEFLLKPQKPPPLVTFDRLVSAAYVLAGVSAITYGASKYLVQPMLETLTDARLDFANTAKEDLYKLNSKLESAVSHIPYSATNTALQKRHSSADDDLESIDSDPTELFHRDIATQTSPARSRSSSFSSTTRQPSDPTALQAARLTSLHTSLTSLLSSTNHNFCGDKLKDSITDFQSTIDKLESSYNPYITTTSAYSGGYLNFDKPVDSSSSNKAPYKTKNANGADTEAARFKSEIRALKGAFLSSRSFPSVKPAVPFTLPAR